MCPPQSIADDLVQKKRNGKHENAQRLPLHLLREAFPELAVHEAPDEGAAGAIGGPLLLRQRAADGAAVHLAAALRVPARHDHRPHQVLVLVVHLQGGRPGDRCKLLLVQQIRRHAWDVERSGS